MPNLRIIPRNFHDEATLTASTEATGYLVTNTQNAIRSRVWRSTSTATATISGTFAVNRTPNFIGLFLHNGHGGSVQLQLYSDAAWTTQVYDSTALALTKTTTVGGYDWGNATTNDPYLSVSPYWLYFTDIACRSYKLTFTSLPGTQTYWEVGRVFLGKYFEPAINPDYGAMIGMQDLTDSNRSRGGSLRTNRGASWRTNVMDLNRIAEAEVPTWLDIMKWCGTGGDLVVSLFPEDGTRKERDNIVNCQFSGLDAIGRQVSWLTKRLQIEEV